MALSPVRLRASISVGSADTIAFTRSNSPALMASMNAAAVSGMGKFYRVGSVSRLCGACGLIVRVAPPAGAPPPLPFEERPPLGAEITVEALAELPTSANLYAVLDTMVPDV